MENFLITHNEYCDKLSDNVYYYDIVNPRVRYIVIVVDNNSNYLGHLGRLEHIDIVNHEFLFHVLLSNSKVIQVTKAQKYCFTNEDLNNEYIKDLKIYLNYLDFPNKKLPTLVSKSNLLLQKAYKCRREYYYKDPNDPILYTNTDAIFWVKNYSL